MIALTLLAAGSGVNPDDICSIFVNRAQVPSLARSDAHTAPPVYSPNNGTKLSESLIGLPGELAVDVEAEKLAIEREKLELERLKARLEASKSRWTAISVAIPVVVALITIVYGFWSSRQAGLMQFQLEAAKSAMNAATPVEGNNRLVFYRKLFPSYLPNSFSAVSTEQESDIEIIAGKKEIYRILTSTKDMTAARALNIWNALFSDEWAQTDELRKAVSAEEVSASGQPPSAQKSSSQTPRIQGEEPK
jgi:hypothetical protein